MGRLRRSVLALLSAAVFLFAFGSYTSALGCPANYTIEQDHSGCSRPVSQDECTLLNCALICLAIPSAGATFAGTYASTKPSFWPTEPRLLDAAFAPDPPPPRLA